MEKKTVSGLHARAPASNEALLKRYTTFLIVTLLFFSNTILVTANLQTNEDPILADSLQTIVYVDPQNVVASVGEDITISVKVADVRGLFALDIEFSWDPTLLEYVDHTVKIPMETYPDGILHGPVLKIKDIVDAAEGTYWLACTSLGWAPVFNGTGIAFEMSFTVLREAACYLHFTSSQLSEKGSPPLPIPHEVRDGNFWSTLLPSFAPIASFTFSPDKTFVDRTLVTFDASTSYDPDGGNIVNYMWDFGDGTSDNTVDPIITHTFHEKGCPLVTLTVEDDEDSISVTLTQDIDVRIYRDIGITSVQVPSQVLRGEEVSINVTVSNLGDQSETAFRIDIYYNETAVDPTNIAATTWAKIEGKIITTALEPAEEYNETFSWDTTDVTAEVYYYVMADTSLEIPWNDVNLTNNVRLSSTPIYIALPSVSAIVDIDPNTLNLKSQGKWITAYIELPESYNVGDIDIYSIMLNDTIPVSLLPNPPVPVPTEIGDYDDDGIPDLMVKFDRAMVQSFIYSSGITCGEVSLTITGELLDGTGFEGTDAISVKYGGGPGCQSARMN